MTIKTFEPKNTKDKLYIRANYSGVSFGELYERIQTHFGVNDDTIFMENFEISAEHIHTDCIGYDRYDPGDHTNFIVVERLAGE